MIPVTETQTAAAPGAYIDGEWLPGAGRVQELRSPVTEEVTARIRLADVSQVDPAVAAARAAFETFSRTSVQERAQLLRRLGEELRARRDELVETVIGELGAPQRIAENVHVDLPIRIVESMAQLVQEVEFRTTVRNSLVRRVPVGVVAAITPWNYPLHQIVAKVAAAFAVGCTVVLKPAEVTSATARLFVEAMERAGFPRGVVNLLCGSGREIGPALIAHPGVDMISFTGSLGVGRGIGAQAGEQIKRVTLELGGKSASLVLPDVRGELLAKAVKVSLANCFLNSGQTCTAWTRLVVPESTHGEVVAMLAEAAEKYRDPARLGPMVTEAQRETVRGYMRRAEAEGATIVAGGADQEFPAPGGWYVAPTVYTDVAPDSEIAREEVFGPVLTVLTYPDDDIDAGVALANDSQYGLSGAVWSADPDQGVAVAERIQAGQVDVNGAAFNPDAPFGGFKLSGVGRELGRAGIEDYLEYQSIQLP